MLYSLGGPTCPARGWRASSPAREWHALSPPSRALLPFAGGLSLWPPQRPGLYHGPACDKGHMNIWGPATPDKQ
jgi:hypothetical protein